jgi:hypothetical protein
MTGLLTPDEVADRPKRHTMLCAFCGVSQHEAEVLIAAPGPEGVFICPDCVESCAEMLAEWRRSNLDEIRRLGT